MINKDLPFINKIQKQDLLPHREPMLLLDNLYNIVPMKSALGHLTINTDKFYVQGHFPGQPVMPGVLQLETMAQAGGVLILSTVENPQDYLTYFLKIDNAKFKKKVVPNEKIIFHLKLISPIRRGLCHMHGKGYVNEKIVVEADLLAQILRK